MPDTQEEIMKHQSSIPSAPPSTPPYTPPSTPSERGQSLVEVALFLPIFIIILAGLIEVSQLVITQNRVTQAARTSARHGAQGGEDAGMVIVALNTVTQTLLMDTDKWDMWVVRGEFQRTRIGTTNNYTYTLTPNSWEFTHVYGISHTTDYTNVNELSVQGRIKTELLRNSQSALLNEKVNIVGLYTVHDVESILGLDAMPWLTGLYSVTGFSYMRQTGQTVVQTNGCDAFPIAVHEGIRSVTPPGQGANPYPTNFDYPSPAPTYASFLDHVPDVALSQAQEGYVYYIQQGFGSGNFGWLLWNTGINNSANSLANSLTWPGDSTDFTNHNDGGQQATPLYPYVVRGYVNTHDSSDTSMHIGDWVAANTGSISGNAVTTQLQNHINRDRTLRLVVWNNSGQQGSNGEYQVIGFAVFRLHGYHLSQGQGGSWILAEFIRWDNSCGQN